MIRAKEAVKIKYIGFSFHDTLPVYKEIIDYFNGDVTQIQYNYMDIAIQATAEGLKYAGSKNIAVVVMEPVKGGQLANPPREAKDVMASSKIERSAVDWTLQYLWNLPEVSVVLSGMSSQKQLDENVASVDGSGVSSISADDRNTINVLVKICSENIVIPCTACHYFMNCPSGVNIPQNLKDIQEIYNLGVLLPLSCCLPVSQYRNQSPDQ
jgi:predicted aldo/keto reductase-like oxidoreductase